MQLRVELDANAHPLDISWAIKHYYVAGRTNTFSMRPATPKVRDSKAR